MDRIGNRKNMQIYSNPSHFANQIIGPQHCEVLPFFQAFTGCDLVSSMLGIGKKTVWNAWNAYPKVTNTFVAIIQDPSSLILDSLHMRRLERWTVLMCIKNCDAELLNGAMKVMFTHSLKSLDYIIFRDVISLLARVFIFLIDRATQEVAIKNI